jgi:hypothetical protein
LNKKISDKQEDAVQFIAFLKDKLEEDWLCVHQDASGDEGRKFPSEQRQDQSQPFNRT